MDQITVNARVVAATKVALSSVGLPLAALLVEEYDPYGPHGIDMAVNRAIGHLNTYDVPRDGRFLLVPHSMYSVLLRTDEYCGVITEHTDEGTCPRQHRAGMRDIVPHNQGVIAKLAVFFHDYETQCEHPIIVAGHISAFEGEQIARPHMLVRLYIALD